MSLSLRSGIASRPSLSLALALAVVGVSALSSSVQAVDVIKADNTDSLDLATSWVGGVAPTSTDVGVFDNTLVTNSTFTFGINQTWGGIRIANPSATITLNGTDSTTAVVLGTSGIDMSAATQDLIVNANLNTGNSQTWNIASGRTMTVNGIYGGNAVAVTKSGAGTLNFNNANTNTGSLVLTNGVVNLNFGAVTSQILSNGVFNMAGGTLNLTGTGTQSFTTMNVNTGGDSVISAGSSNLTIGTLARSGSTGSVSGGVLRIMPNAGLSHVVATATNMANGTDTTIIGDNAGNPYVTLGYDDWAGMDASRNVVAVTYSTNGTSGNADVTSDISYNAVGLNSLRFADASAGHVVTLSGTDTIRGILVTSTSLGGTITGGSIRPNRNSTAGAVWSLIQNSTNGNLVMSTSISNGSNSAPVSVIKSGPGRIVITTASFNSGTWFLNDGALSISAANQLNDNTATVSFQGGKLEVNGTFANTKVFNVGEKGGTLFVAAGNTITNNNILSGTGTLTKTGAGAVVFASANTHTGAINVNAGSFGFTNTSGTATTGTITVASGGTLTGTGITTGNVVVNGGTIAPGVAGLNSSLGTITLANVAFNNGSSLSYDLSAVGGDMTTVTNGLTIGTGLGISLYAANTTNPYGSNGTFNIFNITAGNIPSVSSFQSGFTVTNPATGATYTWGQNGTFITLTISGLALASQWNVDGGGTWGSAGNWTANVPGSAGDTATFGTVLVSGPATVTLDGNRTVGTVAFNNVNQSYTIAQGSSGSLTLNNNAAAAAITVIGNHTISAPVSLASDVNVSTFSASDTLTLSGNISGAKNVNVAGPGKVILSGTNTYNDTVIATGSTLQVGNGGTSGTLGSGTVGLAGTLNFNRTDAIDITSTMSGAGTLNQNGTGTVTLSGANSLTGAVNLNAGKVTVNNATALPTGAAVVNGTLELNGFNASVATLNGANTGAITNSSSTPVTLTVAGAGTYAGSISDNATGTLSLVKSGSGTLALSGAVTATGSVTVSGGGLRIDSNASIGPGPITANGGQLILNNGVSLANPLTVQGSTTNNVLGVAANAQATYSGTITNAPGSAAQLKYAVDVTSTLTLTGTSTASNNNSFFTHGNFLLTGTSGSFTSPGALNLLRNQDGSGQNSLTMVITDGFHVSTSGLNFANGGSNVNNAGGASLTIQNGANVDATAAGNALTSFVDLNGTGTSATTLTLSGGTLSVGGIRKSNAGSTSTVNLNGGLLVLTSSAPSFAQDTAGTSSSTGLVVNIGTGGANIDTGTNTPTFTVPLTGGTGDGGLVKAGTGTLILNGADNYTGITNVTAGQVTFAGGVTHTVGALRGNAVSVDANASVTIPANAGTSKVNSLTIAGSSGNWTGKLDVTNNILAIQTTGGAAKASALADLANQVVSGSNGGAWDGKGITSSSNAGQPNATLATVDNADLGWTTTTDGQPLDANSIFATRAIIGDVNLDGNVDLADYDRWYKHVGTGTAYSYAAGDINMDGNVDLGDYDLWYKHVGAAPLTLASQPALGGGISAVPEPASLAVLALGSAALLGSRRRRK